MFPAGADSGIARKTLNRSIRPFLKSNSRLRMPGRAGSTISSARFLSPSLTLLWDSLRWLSGTRCKTAKDAVLQLRQSSPCALRRTAPLRLKEATREPSACYAQEKITPGQSLPYSAERS